eukprot:CAMPEP_0184019660 /NCGR_PEP_ID=MMETSP0954-20121128/8882_1 /TAXON_ID=627963 /ORGANISM="Aplanochytrium sp, Strain PBS07" /LENGTH=322 /DNA_ID=CAMNT_0026301365 /DNA_START=114 /DNA_END=1083 /DNA_ORIENTATION=+
MKPFSRRGGAKGATGPASMHLPPHIYQLFTARKNLEFKPRIKKANYKKPISGIASLISVFEKELQKAENKPKPLSNAEKKEVRKKERMSKHKENLEVKKAAYNSQKDASSSEKHTSNAYNTLFVARLNYSVDENELKEIFSEYGNLKKVVVVKDSVSGKPRGYGFVEFEHGVDMKAALRRTDGIKIKGRRILVDVERARTVKNGTLEGLEEGLGMQEETEMPEILERHLTERDHLLGNAHFEIETTESGTEIDRETETTGAGIIEIALVIARIEEGTFVIETTETGTEVTEVTEIGTTEIAVETATEVEITDEVVTQSQTVS